jgi:hypothetical protein
MNGAGFAVVLNVEPLRGVAACRVSPPSLLVPSARHRAVACASQTWADPPSNITHRIRPRRLRIFASRYHYRQEPKPKEKNRNKYR